jgi:outer membrane protein assembly factor BamB
MKSTAITCMTLLIATTVSAAEWPNWRGPNYNGSTDETNLPAKWSTTENIVWAADLPGSSAATPIVWQDHVFVSSTDTEIDTLKAICFDRTSGKLLWQHDVAKGIGKDYRSTYSAPSPVTDGKLVVFFYGNGDLLAFDFAGKKLWSRNVQQDYGAFAFLWTFSSSPVLFDGKLYLQVLQRDAPVEGRGLKGQPNESYLLAMDPQSGKTLWRQVRASQAQAESREAFTTPIPYQHDGRTELLVVGGDDLTAHDPATGKELWRWGTWNPTRIGHWRLCPSPVAGAGIVLVCAPKRDPIYAVKCGGAGNLGDSAVAWDGQSARELSSDVPTPAFYDGDFFVLSDVQKTLSRVEPQTGKVKWTVATPGREKYEASPLAADGKLYLINFSGEVTVVGAVDGTILNVIPMGQAGQHPIRSSVVAAGGNLFIRTNTKLFCVGK